MLPFETSDLSITNNQGMNTYPVRPVEGELRIRYRFLADKIAGYSEMAALYRESLPSAGAQTQSGALPFYLNLNGALQYTGSFLGIPTKEQLAMTTFAQAETIIQELADRQVNRVFVRFSDALNGGSDNRYNNTARLVGALGDREELARLQDAIESRDGALFLDADMPYVRDNGWFDGFNSYGDASRNLLKEIAYTNEYVLSTGHMKWGNMWYLVSPSRYPDMFAGFLPAYQKLGVHGVSFATLGGDLSADYSRSHYVDRQQALEIVCDSLQQAKEQGLQLMTATGNGYAAAIAAHVVDAPLTSSRFYIEDESVPFYSMVMHGRVSYAGLAVNQASDPAGMLLLSLEAGACPYFDWMYLDNASLKEREVQAYALQYHTWLDTAAQMYLELNEALAPLQNVSFVRHERPREDVSICTYADGTQILVNYGESAYTQGDVSIPARGYLVRRGGEGA